MVKAAALTVNALAVSAMRHARRVTSAAKNSLRQASTEA
jgi:hypothetical protein